MIDFSVFRDERRKRKLKLADVGKALGVSSATIGNYENNRLKGNLAFIQKLVNFYNISAKSLFKTTLSNK